MVFTWEVFSQTFADEEPSRLQLIYYIYSELCRREHGSSEGLFVKASPKHGRVLIKVGISVVYVIFPISFHETLTVLQLSEMHSSADSLLTSAERKGLPIVCVGGFCDVDGTVSLYRMDEPSSPFLDVFRAAQMHDGSASIGKSEEE